MTLRNQDTQTLELKKKTVQRFAFILNLLGAGAASTVDLTLIDVKFVLKRGGRERVLAHENLQILAQESMYHQGYQHAFQKSTIVLSAGAQELLPLTVDLGSPLNLMGDDLLAVQVTTKTGWYGTFSSSNSSLEVEDREAIGVEKVIPYIRSRALQATISRDQFSIGDNVISVTLLNTESNRTNTDADKVFDSIILNSDKINWNDNRGRIIGRRTTQFEDADTAALRGENFRYIPNAQLDNVQITLGLNGANVAATKNFVVYRQFEIDQEVVLRAQALTQKHGRRNLDKINGN
jgi:hypothetical protein